MNEPEPTDIQAWREYEDYWQKEFESAARRKELAGNRLSVCKAHLEHLHSLDKQPKKGIFRTLLAALW